jgi:MFS family permease
MRRYALALAAGLALADASIVTLGLPSILVELNSSVDGVALVLGVYTVVLAIVLPIASRLATRYGPAQMAAAGAAVFGLASIGCGAVSSLAPLLVLRGVQALGGAGVLVGSFELLDGGRPGSGRRLWVAASVYGIAMGPALGGALTQAFDWRAIFYAQAPIAAAGLIAAVIEIRRGHETEPEPPVALDALPRRPLAALALLSAALTAVIFLVVLLLVAGWSVRPLTAAATVSVLPVSAIVASRFRSSERSADRRAAAGCMLVGAGVCCLALLPGASPWWTVPPQVLAGAGMGLALPALSGELIPERNRADMARLLSVRHIGIALALLILAPVISSSLDTTIKQAREEGTAAMLDSNLDPQKKIDLAPQLFAGVGTEDPRGQLQRSFAEAEANADSGDRPELAALGDRIDSVITGAVRSAFRVAFIVTGALALIAAVILLTGLPGRIGGALLVGGAIAAIACAGVYGVAYQRAERERVKIGDPCKDRDLPDPGGLGGLLQGVSLAALDRTACDFGSSREELLLAIFDDKLRKEYEDKYGEDPRSPLDVGGALLGL